MKKIYQEDEWKVIENLFSRENHMMSESIFSLGNGSMGQRANFEEHYSGKSLQGNYIAGVYYPDKTRVGWWKNGYPEYFAKVLNAPNWIGIDIKIGTETLDLNTASVHSFYRELDMHNACLVRRFSAVLANGAEVDVDACRFLHITKNELGLIRYDIVVRNFAGKMSVAPYIETDVKNSDANYDEKFWDWTSSSVDTKNVVVCCKTKKTGFEVATGMQNSILLNGVALNNPTIDDKKENVFHRYNFNIKSGDKIEIRKYATVVSSLNHEPKSLTKVAIDNLNAAVAEGFDKLFDSHKNSWAAKWEESDIKIEGDVSAQQGIRFNIFQLNQTYTGTDARLNIGPKGFTGEKYGGSTYWDTEAFCLPFYLSTAESSVAKNLLLYRYKQLGNAIKNAEKLGFTNGAALFPMVTMNGEECHNEWEITFEEIHRNGAIAFAVYDYIRYTNDKSYLEDYGLELLIAISRFWAQRTTYSKAKNKFVILGVTGPNEYENNINNNWYTNTMAQWCLDYTRQAIDYVKSVAPNKFDALKSRIHFDENELARWNDIIENMFFGKDDDLGIFLQQDGYLDKEQITVDDLPADSRPLNQKWSWDRILRSCFIKQADVVQGLYCLEDKFDTDTIRRNFDFYEKRTVHESSLSPCIHSVVASKIKNETKAYELYLRTARLDLDDYNNEAHEGCHVTSMAGTWLAIVKGFAGMRVRDNQLFFDPIIPKQWKQYSFNIRFRGNILQIKISSSECVIDNLSGEQVNLKIRDKQISINKSEQVNIKL